MEALFKGSIFEKLPFHTEGAPEPRSFRLVKAGDLKGTGVEILTQPAKRGAALAAAVPEVYLVYANPAATGGVRKLLRGLGVGQQKAIPLSSVSWVRAGWHTPAFRRFIDAGIEIGPRDRCFSVMTSTRSLDLICGSARECADWVAGLNEAVAAVQGRPADADAGLVAAASPSDSDSKGRSQRALPSAPLEDAAAPPAAAQKAASTRRLSDGGLGSRRGSGASATTFASAAAANAYFAQTVFPAIAEGRFDDVLLAFEDGCPIEIVDPLTSETPLLAACRAGEARIARLCLDRFAVFNPVPGGDTALHVACRHGHVDVVRVIINTVEEGVAADIEETSGGPPSPSSLADAVSAQLASVLGLATKRGELPFHLAAAGGHHEVVAMLLLKCSGLVLRRDKLQRTPLHAACAALPSRASLADGVLAVSGGRSGAGHPSAGTDDPERGTSAASVDEEDDGASVSTAVHTKSRAASLDSSFDGGAGSWALKIAEAADLMASPASSIGHRGGDGGAGSPMSSPLLSSPQQSSSRRGSRSGSSLTDGGGSPSDTPAPLLTAAARGAAAEAALEAVRAPFMDTIRLLLDHGADETLDWGDAKGYTPLHYAVARGAAGVVAELLQSAANPLVHADNPLSGTQEPGPTPLDLARSTGVADIVSLLDDYCGLFRPERAAAKTVEKPKRQAAATATPDTGAFVFPDTVERTATAGATRQGAGVGTASRDPRARLFLSPLAADSPASGAASAVTATPAGTASVGGYLDSPASEAGFFSPAAGAAPSAPAEMGMTSEMAAAAHSHGMSSSHLLMCTNAFLDYLRQHLPLVADGSVPESEVLPAFGAWSTVLDYTYGAPYYFNADSQESTWEPPADLVVGWLTQRVAFGAGALGVPAPAAAAAAATPAAGGSSAPASVAAGSDSSSVSQWEAPQGVVSLLSPRAKATPMQPRAVAASTAKKAAAIKPGSLPMSPLAIPLALNPISAATATTAAASTQPGAPLQVASSAAADAMPAPASPAAATATPFLSNPAYAKYLRMARSGVPLSAVVQAMANEGIDATARAGFGAEIEAKRKAGQPLPAPASVSPAAGTSPESGSASARVDLPAAAAAVAVAAGSSSHPRSPVGDAAHSTEAAPAAAPSAPASSANPLRSSAPVQAPPVPAAQARPINPLAAAASAPAPAVAAVPQPVLAAAPAPPPVVAESKEAEPVKAAPAPSPAVAESKEAEPAPAAPAPASGDVLSDPRYEPYLRMVRMGLPLRGPVAHRMAREGVPAPDVEAFIAAIEARGGNLPAAAPVAESAAPVAADKPAEPEAAAAAAPPSAAELRREALAKITADPRFEKFLKMKRAGVPLGAIKERMGIEGLSADDQKAFLAAHASDSTLERMGLASPPPAASKAKAAHAPAPAPAAAEAAAGADAQGGGAARPSTVKLHWDPLKLSAEQLANTVWGSLANNDGGGDGEDMELLTAMFASKGTGAAPAAAAGAGKGGAGGAKGGAGGDAHGGAAGAGGAGSGGGGASTSGSKTLLDFKRANNLNISLAQFRKFPSHVAIFSAVYRLDTAALSREALEKLSLLTPTAEEAKALREYKGPVSALIECDRFFIAVAGVPRFGAKVGAFCLLQSFKAQAEEAMARASLLAAACAQVMESKRLQQVLGHVLTIGNVLNQGNTRLEAQAISLDSLLKLSATRSADRKTTLLDALVILVDRKGGDALLSFGDDLQTACSARRLELNDIKNDAAKLVGAAAAARREADAEAQDLAREEAAAAAPAASGALEGAGEAAAHKPVPAGPSAASSSEGAAGGRAGMLAELMRKRSEGAGGGGAATAASSGASTSSAHHEASVAITSPTRLGMAGAGSSVIAGRRRSLAGGEGEVPTARVKLGFAAGAAAHKVPNPCSPEDRRIFINGMSAFCASAEAELSALQARVAEAERAANKLVSYFGEDPRSTPSSRVLGVLCEFVDGFRAAATSFKRRQATDLKRQASVSNVRVSLAAPAPK